MNQFKRNHFSPSSRSTYFICGKRFEYSYILERPRKESAALIIGKAVDSAMQVYFNDKDKTNPHDTYYKLIDESILKYSGEEPEIVEELEELKERIADALSIYFDEYAPYYEPIVVQKKIQIQIEGLTLPILGYCDLIAKHYGKKKVIDHKTSGKSINTPKSDHVKQLAVYTLAYMKEESLNEIPDAELHVIVKTKKPKIQIVPVQLSEQIFSDLIDEFFQLQQNIKKNFFPKNRESFLCSEKWCDFYHECHESNGMKLDQILDSIQIVN